MRRTGITHTLAKLALSTGLTLGTLLLAGCTPRSPAIRAPVAIHAPATLGSGVLPTGFEVEPEDGVGALIRAVDRAQSTVYLEAYVLTHPRIIRALERASAQGVKVYVVLEHQSFGMGLQPEAVARQLRAAGIHVRWGRPGFRYTRAKFLLVDGSLAVIGTANFSRAAFSRNREFLMFERDRRVVRDLQAIFVSDWDSTRLSLGDDNVVTAPDDARARLSTLIARAHRSIDIYAEEMADPLLEQKLAAAAKRGVRVRIIVPQSVPLANISSLLRARVAVRLLQQPYAHAKMILVDGTRAFVGSENFSATSLDHDREVGLLIRGPTLSRIAAVFAVDWFRAVAPHDSQQVR